MLWSDFRNILRQYTEQITYYDEKGLCYWELKQYRQIYMCVCVYQCVCVGGIGELYRI